MMKKTVLYIALLASLLITSCEIDSYEKGEGAYSLMQANFCELHTNSEMQGVSFVTDEGERYQFSTPVAATWIETADTTYRAIIYFNKVGANQAEPRSVGPMVTLQPVAHWHFKEMPQDPIGLESAWIAKSGKYLNVGLLLKTGRIDDEELPHNVGLAQDTVYTYADGRRAAYYRLLHSQNGIPQYYTNRRYISILLPEERPDTIHLSIQTYEGTVERVFIP